MIGFALWCVCGMTMIGLGIYAFFARKPMGFWANAEVFSIAEVRGYNRAVGKLFCLYGSIFILLGLPLLKGQNSPGILLSILGVMLESIALMVVYTTVIERKYRKK